MLIYFVWGAGIALTGAAALHMARIGLMRMLPPLWAYLAFSAVYSAAMLSVRRADWHVYLSLYSAGTPLILLFKCAAVTAIFWALTSNYPRFQKAGSIFFGIFAAFGVVAAWVTAFLAPPVHASTLLMWLWHGALLLQRYASVAILVLLFCMIFLLPRTPNIPLPKFAMRAARLMAVDAALGIVAAWGQHWMAYRYPTGAALAATGYGVAAGCCWMFLRVFVEVPASIPSPEELEQSRREIAAEMHMAYVRIDDAVRTYERSRYSSR